MCDFTESVYKYETIASSFKLKFVCILKNDFGEKKERLDLVIKAHVFPAEVIECFSKGTVIYSLYIVHHNKLFRKSSTSETCILSINSAPA